MIIMKLLTKVTKVSLQAGPEGRIGSSGSGGRCISSYLSLFFFLNIIINYLLIFIIVIIISSIYREADASPHICSLYFFLNIIIHKYLLIHLCSKQEELIIMYKNGHILPTEQWYAPSAVINDALVVHILHILHILVWSDHHMTS